MLVMTLFSATATAQQKDTVVTAVGYTTSERDDMTGKMIVQSFINDKLHGVKTVSLENKVLFRGYYENGLPVGVHTEYLMNGDVNKETSFIDGTYNGPTTYYIKGKRISQVFFVGGVKQGIAFFYDSKGRVKSTRIYNLGILRKIEFFNKNNRLYGRYIFDDYGDPILKEEIDEKGMVVKVTERPHVANYSIFHQ